MSEAKRVLYWGMTDNIGGIESFIINVYRNIDRTKVQIDFLLNHNQDKIAFEDEILRLGGRIYRIMYSERESLIKSRSELKKFFKTHNEFIAVHIHANFLYTFPLKYAKKYNIPIRILHSHNSAEDEYHANTIRKLYYQFRNYLVRRQINKYPNMYIACSEKAADYMFPGKDYKWIKNGIDIDKYKYDDIKRQEIRTELGITDDEYVIGFIGRLREQKNPYFIIDIFSEYIKLDSNSRLVIVGIGEWEEDVKRYAKSLIDNNRALFIGRRSDADKLYQAFDTFLLPSFYEGLPVVLVEAQVAGLKCYTSDVVTKQVEITDLIKYYSLDLPAAEWAKRIYKNKSQYIRDKYVEVIKKQGFDAKDSAKELEKIYLGSDVNG